MNKVKAYFIDLGHKILNVGIVSSDEGVRRRHRFTNMVLIVTAFNAFHHLIMNGLHDFWALLPVNIYNFCMIICALSLVFMHRYGEYLAAVLLAFFIFFGNSFVVMAFGLNSDLQIYFTLAGAFIFMVGVQNTHVYLPLLGAGLMALIGVYFFASDEGFLMVGDQTFRRELALQAYVNAILINSLLIFYALSSLYKAEQALALEYQRSEKLLTTILPVPIAERLKAAPKERIADRVEDATILFADLVGFTRASHNVPPEDVVAYLDDLFTTFDGLCENYSVDKIKTIGDGYLAVGGLHDAGGARAIGFLALDMIEQMNNRSFLGLDTLSLRIGIHRGPVTAGIIGDQRMTYDVWGSSVNCAARLEAQSLPSRIHCSEAFVAAVQDTFQFTNLDVTELRGVGVMNAGYLLRQR
ncbi:adenylate cyclase [Hyphomicrobiales bacterium 4NK60-0047b]